MERDLKFCLCGNPSEEQHRKNGMIVYRGICTTCLVLKRRKIPDYVDRGWLYNRHVIESISLEKLAVELNIKESHVLHLLKLYEIDEIKHCRYCDTTENLRKCKVNNKWMNEKESIHKICQSCYEREKSMVQREAVQYTDYKTANINQKKTKKERYGDENYNNTIKAQESYKDKPGKKEAEVSKQMETKSKHTPEQKQQRTDKYLDSMEKKTPEEKQLRLVRMGHGVSKTLKNRSPEKKRSTKLKHRIFNMQKFGVPYHVIGVGKLHEANRNKTLEEKEAIKLKSLQKKILNESFTQKKVSISLKAFDLFNKIDNYFNNTINFKYTKFDENGVRIKREQGIYVGNLGLSDNRCRYLDFYFKNEDEIRIAFEFDEYHHKNTYEADLLRETEIFLNRPGLYLFRIPEEYYDNNFSTMFEDLIKLIQDPTCDTVLNYDNLTQKLEKKKPLID